MRRRLQVVCGIYLAVLSFGVFGPQPGDEIDRAATQLRELEAEVRDRIGVTTSTAREVSPGEASSGAAAPVLPQAGTDPFGLTVEEFFNVLLFVPFGLLVPLCWPSLRWATVPLGCAASVGIEMVQGQFLSWRSQTSIDFQMNSLGVLIGFGLWVLLHVVVMSARAWRHG